MKRLGVLAAVLVVGLPALGGGEAVACGSAGAWFVASGDGQASLEGQSAVSVAGHRAAVRVRHRHRRHARSHHHRVNRPAPTPVVPTPTTGSGPPSPPTDGSGTDAPPAPGPAHVQVVESDPFRLTLSRTSVAAGPVAVELDNMGADPHDLRVERLDAPATGFDFPLVGPGHRVTQTLRLTAGTWKLYCMLPGHEEAGMQALLTVR